MQFDGINWPPLIGIQDGEYKLTRTANALEVLGNPHIKLKNVIHVAGTNGKGSVTAFLQNVMNANGFTTNVYTSPHLVAVNERIKIHSQNISDDLLTKYTKEVYYALKESNLENSLTYFEAMTVIAFYSFFHESADFNIIEVGLGGRFDATNVINNPLVSVITSISLDHMDYLGNTIEKIAVEKCEIVKPNCSAIMGFQKSESVYDIFKFKCELVDAPYSICDTINHFDNELDSTFQSQNTTTALAVLDVISQKINFEFERGKSIQTILQTKWHGRMETVFLEKFNKEILVDCAHNLDGITHFIDFISKQKGRKVLIFGMLSRKVRSEILQLIHDALDDSKLGLVITVNFGKDGECIAAETLEVEINHKHCVAMEDFDSAIAFTRNFDKTFLCGSIHLIGDFFGKYGV